MDQQQFNRLVEIVNEAKNIGNYDIANSAFAVALEHYGNKDAAIFIETDSSSGKYSPYYDLVCVTSRTDTACIPTPLLHTLTVASAYKAGRFVEREAHNRETSITNPELEQSLREELISLAGSEQMIAAAIRTHLALVDDDSEPFYERLVALWEDQPAQSAYAALSAAAANFAAAYAALSDDASTGMNCVVFARAVAEYNEASLAAMRAAAKREAAYLTWERLGEGYAEAAIKAAFAYADAAKAKADAASRAAYAEADYAQAKADAAIRIAFDEAKAADDDAFAAWAQANHLASTLATAKAIVAPTGEGNEYHE
jgi:hypothetical protein